MTQIHVVVTLSTNEQEFPKDLLDTLENNIPIALKDAGCLKFKLLRDIEVSGISGPDRKNVYTIIEEWADMESVEKYAKAPDAFEILIKMAQLGVRADLRIYQNYLPKE